MAMAELASPDGWHQNVARVRRGEQQELVMTCLHVYFDCNLRFDVHYNTDTKECTRLEGTRNPWSRMSEFPTESMSLFLPGGTLPLRQNLHLPMTRFHGEDPNDRRTLKSFQMLYEQHPALRNFNCPIILEIEAPFVIEDHILNALVEFLGMSPLHRNVSAPDSKALTIVAEPISDELWPKTVKLDVKWVNTFDILPSHMFSLKATGHFDAASLRVGCSRLFPFLIEIDLHDNKIEKSTLMHNLFMPFTHPVNPSVGLHDVMIPTFEHISKLLHLQMGDTTAWNAPRFSIILTHVKRDS